MLRKRYQILKTALSSRVLHQKLSVSSLPNFANLTPDDRIWRTDWFGDVAYPGSVRRYAQPSIKVALSPLLSDQVDLAQLFPPEGTDHQHARETWIPIAALPMVAIGDLWQHGQPIASPSYEVETFKKLIINPETTAFLKAGLAIDEHFLLPLKHHPWHRLHTQSYCVAVSLGDQRRLLVPCVEIIRFYFGSSSNFLQRLFTAPLTPERLWISKRFNPANRHLHLELANRLSGLSAKDIGRIAESKFAWRAAAGIYASCQKASAQGLPVYPYTGFPFEGATNLVASGVWLPFGDQERSTFLVYRLRSCSYPFPFQSLSYKASDWKARQASSGQAGAQAKQFSHRHSQPSKTETAEQDAAGDRTQRQALFASPRQFPDLQYKSIWRDKIETTPGADVFLKHEDGRVEQVAIGESPWSSAITGLDVSRAEADEVDVLNAQPLPWFVKTGLRDIKADPAYQAPEMKLEIVCPSGRSQPVFFLPEVIDDDGVIANQLIFTEEQGTTRLRRGCFATIGRERGEPDYLLILEGETRSAPPNVAPAECADLKHACEIAIGKAL